LIGTAFDYLLRFELRRRAPHAVVAKWIADAAPDKFWCETTGLGHSVGRSRVSDEQLIILDANARFDPHGCARQFRQQAAALLARAHSAEESYVRQQEPSKVNVADLARHALRLAALDPIVRVSMFTVLRDFEPFAEPSDQDVQELVGMLDLVPFQELTSPYVMLLNPTFGQAGELVGGADADLVAGDLLVDFKVTTKVRIEPTYLDQIIGYLLLARQRRRLDATAPDIRRLGLYYARQGHLWTASVAELTTGTDFAAFERWFLDRTRDATEERPSATRGKRR
jgi:hypothetical protein